MASNLGSISLVKDWKTSLQAYPTKSTLSLKNLWELIYDDRGIPLIDSALTSSGVVNTSIGCKLDHDIICFAQSEYATGNPSELNVTYKSQSLTKEEGYALLAIDASIALYDKRSKVRTVSSTASIEPNKLGLSEIIISSTNNTSIFTDEAYYCHDKNSVLRPASMADFIKQAVFVAEEFTDNDMSTEYYGQTGKYLGPGVAALSSSVSNSFPIYLNKQDTAFRGTLSTDSTVDAYNLVIFNPKNNVWVPSLVLKALWSQLKNKNNAGIFNEVKVNSNFSAKWKEIVPLTTFVFQQLPSLIDNTPVSSDLAVNPDKHWADLLKHTYIWIKAPFFGDYIQTDVFNQDLSSESNVKHRNLVISDSGDFNKYNETTSNTSKLDTETYPYIPKTGPGYDILTPKLFTDITTGVQYTKPENLKLFIDECDKNEDSKIGSLNFVGSLQNETINVLPNYFDPEVDYASGDLRNTPSYFPTVIPSAGNIYADGRIISPTIDELWIYIKQLTEGRRSDTAVTLANSEQDCARAINNEDPYKINDDTILSSPTKMEYNIDGTHSGDIIDVSIEPNASKENVINPIAWVNNNRSIKYNIYNALERISSTVTKFDLSNKDDNGKSTREITNFTAWCYADNTKNDVLVNGNLGTVATDGNIWQPRADAPYSLRELEALSKGNKYNIITLARFIENNYTVAGPLGYKYYNDESEESIGSGVEQAAGSLYQFHRDYNFKVDNPNTFFRKNGEGDDLFDKNSKRNITTSGMDASFNDLTNVTGKESDVKLYNSENLKTSKMPLLVENYGKSVYLSEEFGDYSGADIYMAADGTWRYKAEHSRIPILRSRY